LGFGGGGLLGEAVGATLGSKFFKSSPAFLDGAFSFVVFGWGPGLEGWIAARMLVGVGCGLRL
jgi:hypothetical protein